MEEKIIEAKFTKNELRLALLYIGEFFVVAGILYALGIYNKYNYGFSILDFPYFMFESMLNFFCFDLQLFPALILLGVISILLSLFFHWEMSKCALIVTNRRVTGKASFGKHVDLPLNQISAVSLGIFSRITVSTASGHVHFWFVENREEVHSALTNIIGKVQVESAFAQTNNVPTTTAPSYKGDIDELKKYKELLDSGIITQEEFDAKKKQILGL